jgi:hypothetical protein
MMLLLSASTEYKSYETYLAINGCQLTETQTENSSKQQTVKQEKGQQKPSLGGTYQDTMQIMRLKFFKYCFTQYRTLYKTKTLEYLEAIQ